MPKFTANPIVVTAYEITAVSGDGGNSLVSIVYNDDAGTPNSLELANEITIRYTPVVGDYFISLDDGYQYINPRAIFEKKYTLNA